MLAAVLTWGYAFSDDNEADAPTLSHWTIAREREA